MTGHRGWEVAGEEDVLQRVTYYNLAGALWDRLPGIHMLDLGLDLEFAHSRRYFIWDQADQSLLSGRGSALDLLHNVESLDVTKRPEWCGMIGDQVSIETREAQSVATLSVGGDIRAWIAAAWYDPENGILVPRSDSVAVVFDPALASALGLESAASREHGL